MDIRKQLRPEVVGSISKNMPAIFQPWTAKKIKKPPSVRVMVIHSAHKQNQMSSAGHL